MDDMVRSREMVACKRAFAVGVLMRQKKVVGEIGVKRRV